MPFHPTPKLFKEQCEVSVFDLKPYSPAPSPTPTLDSYYAPKVIMSDHSVNLSNESPASRSPSPLPIAPPEAFDSLDRPTGAQAISPQSALNILDGQPTMSSADLRDLARSLVTTTHQREVMYKLQLKQVKEQLQKTGEQLNEASGRLAAQQMEVEPSRPDGFQDNNGRVTALVPLDDDYYVAAKWIRQRPDRRVELLTGLEEGEEPRIVDLYAIPDYRGLDPVEVMPTWFHHMLRGPTKDFHDLREAVAKLDDWAEIGRAHV